MNTAARLDLMRKRLDRYIVQLENFRADSSTSREQLQSLERRIALCRDEIADLTHPVLFAEEPVPHHRL